jgi:hypothetical protein
MRRITATGWAMIAVLMFWTVLGLMLVHAANASPSIVWAPSAVAKDSTIVRASWSQGCDVRGCPTGYEVTWSGAQRSVRRVVAQPSDTFTVPWPAWGDSLKVTVSVRSIRRTLQGPVTTGETWVTRPDAPPPAVDSLQVHPDTVAVLAWRDSFPASAWETRPATGWQYALEGGDSVPLPSWQTGIVLEEGHYTVFCTFAVNQYTGVRQLMLSPDVLFDDAARCRTLADKLGALRDA